MKTQRMMIAGAAMCALAVSACATKRYPMETELSEAELAFMDCRDLQREMLRGEQVRRTITDTAELDWRSAAGFLGDWGIGNAMARNEAEQALETRIASIRRAQVQRGCLEGNNGGEPANAPSVQP